MVVSDGGLALISHDILEVLFSNECGSAIADANRAASMNLLKEIEEASDFRGVILSESLDWLKNRDTDSASLEEREELASHVESVLDVSDPTETISVGTLWEAAHYELLHAVETGIKTIVAHTPGLYAFYQSFLALVYPHSAPQITVIQTEEFVEQLRLEKERLRLERLFHSGAAERGVPEAQSTSNSAETLPHSPNVTPDSSSSAPGLMDTFVTQAERSSGIMLEMIHRVLPTVVLVFLIETNPELAMWLLGQLDGTSEPEIVQSDVTLPLDEISNVLRQFEIPDSVRKVARDIARRASQKFEKLAAGSRGHDKDDEDAASGNEVSTSRSEETSPIRDFVSSGAAPIFQEEIVEGEFPLSQPTAVGDDAEPPLDNSPLSSFSGSALPIIVSDIPESINSYIVGELAFVPGGLELVDGVDETVNDSDTLSPEEGRSPGGSEPEPDAPRPNEDAGDEDAGDEDTGDEDIGSEPPANEESAENEPLVGEGAVASPANPAVLQPAQPTSHNSIDGGEGVVIEESDIEPLSREQPSSPESSEQPDPLEDVPSSDDSAVYDAADPDVDLPAINANSGDIIIENFTGVGTGTDPGRNGIEISDITTLVIDDSSLSPETILFEQGEGELVITFEDIDSVEITLRGLQSNKPGDTIALEDFDNLPEDSVQNTDGSSVGNIVFSNSSEDEFDVIDVFNAQYDKEEANLSDYNLDLSSFDFSDQNFFSSPGRNRVFGPDRTTFLNDNANIVFGFDPKESVADDPDAENRLGEDVINGQGGDDILWGKGGNDTLRGGEGNDILHGGKGDDTLTGNAGSDRFILTPNAGTDTITDFTLGEDEIVLQDGLSASDLVIQSLGSNTEIRVNGQAIAILLSVDGDALTQQFNTTVTENLG